MVVIGSMRGSFFAGERPKKPPVVPNNPPDTLSGVVSESELQAYFGPAPGTAFRLLTYAAPQAYNISYAPVSISDPSLLSNSILVDNAQNIDGATYPLDVRFTDGLRYSSQDECFFTVPIPWGINYLGKTYPIAYINSNSYITFGNGILDVFSGLDYSIPFLPKIMISSSDNALRSIKYAILGTPGNRRFVVWFEGAALPYYLSDRPMTWEVWFYESNPAMIDLHIIDNYRWQV